MKALLSRCALALVLLGASLAALAADQDVIYVNGIMNTEAMAEQSRYTIEIQLRYSPYHQSAPRTFSVRKAFNPIGWYDGDLFSWDGVSWAEILVSLPRDEKELFIQKSNEEYFKSALSSIATPWSVTTPTANGFSPTIWSYGQTMLRGYSSLESGAGAMPADAMGSSQKTVSDLVTMINQVPSTIIIAHSQGNLLANIAYAKFASDLGKDVGKKLRVINVANTSEISANGLNLTHSKDGALYSSATRNLFDGTKAPDVSLEQIAYRGLDAKPDGTGNFQITRNTPSCANIVCAFTVAPATFVNADEPSALDGVFDRTSYAFGHDFVGVYMSSKGVHADPTYWSGYTPTLSGYSSMPEYSSFLVYFEEMVYMAAKQLDLNNTLTPAFVFSDVFYPVGDTSNWTYNTQHQYVGDALRIVRNDSNYLYGKTEQISPTLSFPYGKTRVTVGQHWNTSSSGYYTTGVTYVLANGQQFTVLFPFGEAVPYYNGPSGRVNVPQQMMRVIPGPMRLANNTQSQQPLAVSGFWMKSFANRASNSYANIDYNAVTGDLAVTLSNPSSGTFTTNLPSVYRSAISSVIVGASIGNTGESYDIDSVSIGSLAQ